MNRREAASLAADALKLRRWTLRLSGLPQRAQVPGTDAAAGTEVPVVPPRAWELFLRAERCAAPLRRRISVFGLADLPADAARVISALALEEMQRVISARAQLRRLSKWAGSAGTDIVILKGAVPAMDDDVAVDLSDIDLWIEPAMTKSLLEWLTSTGHVPKRNSSQYHHAGRLTDQLVSVEVHHEIPHANLDADWMHEIQPLHPSLPRLNRLSAADNLWHVLVHSTMQHIDRRGRIRDVLLLAGAHSFCADADAQVVRDRARAHAGADALLPMLEMAEAIGTRPDLQDPFAAVAAGRYLDTASGPHHPALRFLHSHVATTAVLYGVHGCAEQIEKVRSTRAAITPVPMLRSIQRRSPRIGGTLVVCLRLAKRTAALLFALPRAYTARRLANRQARHNSGYSANLSCEARRNGTIMGQQPSMAVERGRSTPAR